MKYFDTSLLALLLFTDCVTHTRYVRLTRNIMVDGSGWPNYHDR